MRKPCVSRKLVRGTVAGFAVLLAAVAAAAEEPHPLMTWVKRHPQEKTTGKPSPKMGYETTYGYDPLRKLLIRHSGHNQGGGGEQNSEVWTYDLDADVWALKEPNDAPPGVCCGQQNVFDDALRRFIRFPSFSGSHGWQSPREIYLKDSSVWTYDLDTNAWRVMRPCPEVWPSPLRGAAYDPELRVTVLHGGETSGHGTVVYDLYTNTWHAMKPAGGPDANISQPGFTYDAVHRLFVLFGSQFQSDPRTWAYDLYKNKWRALNVKEHPPADKSCPVLAADTRNGIVLCSVQGANGLETWALDVAKPAWRRLKLAREPDPSGGRNRVLIYLPDRNLFVLENRTKDEQQVWTFRYADAPPAAPQATDLHVTTGPDSATLTWKAPQAAGVRYTIYLWERDTPWATGLGPIALVKKDTTFQHRGIKRGTTDFYQVRTVDDQGKEVAASPLVSTQPPVVIDLLVSVPNARRAELEWKKPPAEDIVGYYVERADVSVYSVLQVKRIRDRYRQTSDLAVGRIKAVGPFRRLTERPVEAPQFVDEAVDLASGQKEPAEPIMAFRIPRDQVNADAKPYRYATYAYRVIAVNRLGVESGPSPLVFTYPSAVQHVFSKEEAAGKTRLRWQPSREKSIPGYHVYRQDGRWDTDPIVRLTANPIAATEFLDENAGEPTRRYEVVAVDALGQEGEPSQPVWSRREWARYYGPYVGPWHQ
jgi:fibronectin type 3 domain-containing protein